MVIELRNLEFSNKGAELMLLAVLDQLRNRFPEAKIALAPHVYASDFNKKAQLGLYSKFEFIRLGFDLGNLFLSFIPKSKRLAMGVIIESDVDYILDGSGFAYSDQWGVSVLKFASKNFKRWKSKGIKSVLLPQAFGPFESNGAKPALINMLDNIDLAFTRDDISYKYVTGVYGEKPNVRQCPDFTNLLKGDVPTEGEYAVKSKKIAVIPNYRMLDKSDLSKEYTEYLTKSITILQNKGFDPFFLIHDAGNEDDIVAQEINQSLKKPIQSVTELEPLRVKGMIGNCRGIISSRFHGLVNALSQGVPSVAIGWSHKYEMLLKDYQCPDSLVNLNGNIETELEKLNVIFDDNENQVATIKIEKASNKLKQQVKAMWEEVFGVLSKKN